MPAADVLIPFPSVNAWLRAAAYAGFSINQALLDAGLVMTSDGKHLIRRDGLVKLMTDCTGAAAPQHHFPLLVGEAFAFDTVPAIEMFLATSPTLRDALRIVAWISRLMTDLDIRVYETADEAVLDVSIPAQTNEPLKANGYFVEATLTCLLKFARTLLGSHYRLYRVELRHDPGPVRERVAAQFGAQVLPHCENNRVIMATALLDMPLPGAVPETHRQLRAIIERQLPSRGPASLGEQLTQLFRDNPHLTGQGLAKTADRLHMHPRTLQRRLKTEGLMYADIQTRCRYEYAIAELKKPRRSVDAISETLGFSDRNSFTRAFKEWTGQTPRDFRRRYVLEP